MLLPLLVGPTFILLGLFVLHWWRKQHGLMQDAAAWPTAPGKVLECRINRARPGDDADDLFSFVFDYEVDGRTHVGTRVGFFEMERRLTLAQMEDLQRRYPVGGAVRVHYQRTDPRVAVLEPADRTTAAPTRNLAFVLIAVGAAVLFFATVARA